MGRPWALVSGGIVVILGALFYLLSIMGLITFAEVPGLTIAGLGVWLLVLSGMKSMEPAAGEMEASITAGWGVILLVLGAVGALSARGYPLGVLLVVLGLVLGFLVVFAALRMWPRKAVEPAQTGVKQ